MKKHLKISMMLLMVICLAAGLHAENLDNLISVPISLKVGLQNEPNGQLVLKETEPGMFEKGELIISVLDDKGQPLSGISFETKESSSLNLKVQGDLKAELNESLAKTTEEGQITIDIKRSSSQEAAVLVLSDFTVTVDRMVPFGNYDLKIYGSSLDGYSSVKDNYLLVEDFVQITTTSSSLLYTGSGLKGRNAAFTVGSTICVAGSESITMSRAAYSVNEQTVMVPAVDALKALGVKENKISYAAGKLTIVQEGRIIQFSRNSRRVLVNGVEMSMENAFIVSEGKCYLAASDLGKLLGLKSEWQADTQTIVLYTE